MNIYNYLAKLFKSQVINTKNFKDIEIEINLPMSATCNLNCTNCQALCNLNDKEEFLTLNDLKYSLPILKKFFNNQINSFILFGGEPLLNPQFKEICKYIRYNFPQAKITIFTNGIILSNWTAENYQFAKNLNISFRITLYPIKEYINKIEKQEKIFIENNIDYEILNIRPFFVKSSFNYSGSNDENCRFFSCCHGIFPPPLFLHKNRLYKCAVEPNLHKLNLPVFQEDYLEIEQLTESSFLQYCSQPLKICKYCGADDFDFSSDEIFPWKTQNEQLSNYSQSLFSLYLNDYNTYHNFIYNNKDLIETLNNDYYLSKYTDSVYPSDPFPIFLNRFKTGLGDVCIPFSQNILSSINLKEFKKNLLNQKDFDKINFYFLSLDKNKEAKKIMYKAFPPFSQDLKGNFYFLQGNNNYNEFFTNSFLNKKFILNNILKLKDSNYLQKMLKIEEDKYETI